ncbi:MAG: hypothetical protein ACRD1E_10655, partial [Terriglobales bacterium]
LWLERGQPRGAAPADAEAALQSPSVRAVLMARDGLAEAAVLDPDDAAAAAAWQALQPRPPASICADFWMCELPQSLWGWFDWPGLERLSAGVDQLRAAVAAVSERAQAPAAAIVLDFSNGRDPDRARREPFLQTLAARAPAAQAPMLYSPLFYREGALDAARLLAAVHRAPAAAVPLLCVPRLPRQQFFAALEAAGGSCSGRLRAGAEIDAAALSASASASTARATLRWLGSSPA